MCSPNTAMSMQLGGGLAQTGLSFYGAKIQKSAASGEAAIDDINARLAESSAQDALAAGQREEQQSDLKTAQLKSSQRATMAANGIDLSSDTAVNLLTSTDVMGQVDAKTIAGNAMRTAFGYRAQGVGYSNQGVMNRAKAAGVSPFMEAGSSLLTSASNFALGHAALQKAGSLPKDDWYSRTIGKW